MMKRNLSCQGQEKVYQLWSWAVALLVGILMSVTWGDSAQAVSHSIYTPTHIRPDEAKQYLAQLSLGTVSRLPGTQGLLITADAETLTKAETVLRIVDAGTRYHVEVLGQAAAVRDLPDNATLMKRVSGLTMGSFKNPPQGKAGQLALIDLHGKQVIVIAPSDKMETIRHAVEGTSPVVYSLLQASSRPDLYSPITSLAQSAQPQLLASTAELITDMNESSTVVPPGRITDTGPNLLPNQNNEVVSISAGPPSLTDRSSTIALAQKAETTSPSEEAEPATVDQGQQELTLALPEQLPLKNLLALVGEYLKLNFVYEATDLKDDIKISLMLKGKQRGSVKVDDLYPLLESVLKFKGFVMTRKGAIVQVVPVDKAMDIDPSLHVKGDLVENGDAIVTHIFQLKHVTPETAENLLSKMKLGVGTVGIDETKTLIVTDFAYRMPRIETILNLADTLGEAKEYRYRQLQYTMAQGLKDKVSALAEQLGSVEVSITTAPQTVERRRGEGEASYQARVRASQRAQAASHPSPKKTQDDVVYLDADERTNRVLMIGHKKQLDLVNDLIDSLDVEQQDLRTLKPYPIKFLEAQLVYDKFVELEIIAPSYRYGSSSNQRLSGDSRVNPTAGQTSRPPTPSRSTNETSTEAIGEEGGGVDEPQIIVIEATNSLLVNATSEQHQKIANILAHIDRETDLMSIPYRIYPLKNQSPEELAGVLEKLIVETIEDKEGKIEKKRRNLEENIVVVPDEKSFSLIVYASPKNQEWVASLIETLDRPRPQVLIDVTLVEVTQNDEFNYDLNVLGSIPDLTETSGLTSAIMGPVPAGSISLVDRLTNSSRDRFIDMQSNNGNGVGFYGDEHINVLLKAVDAKNLGRVLAKPKVLVNDGETGIISTTDTTYVYTQEGTVNTSAATSLVQTAVKWDAYDAGISLEITPNINEGDLLRLNVVLSRSDFLDQQEVTIGADTFKSPPNTVTSDVTTVVTVPDESTIILGGMLKLNQSKGGNKVPLFGDLPLIGGLFRGVKNKDKQSHLYVFVKAEIIRPSEVLAGTSDLDRISEQHRVAFEKQEAEFQMYESWPGVKAQPVSPKKVLDAR